MNDLPVYELRGVEQPRGLQFLLSVDALRIAHGESLGLLGPTGAGKSTLLKLLAGLERAGAGEVRFEGKPLSAESLPLEIRRRIVLVHQQPILLSGAVRYNVEYGLRLREVRHIAAKTDAVLDRLGLRRLASQPAHTLSGGEIQLVALARALVVEPDVLLLDEPTANLDPARVAIVEETIQEIRQARTMTVVWATHNLFQARRVAERTALLLNGRLIEAASTADFFERPADPRTADFVQGRMVY